MDTRMVAAAVLTAFVFTLAGTATAGLTGYWPLDEGAGITVDDAVSTENGDLDDVGGGGGPYWTGGKWGSSADMQYTWRIDTNRTTTELNIDGNKPRSISMWVRYDPNTFNVSPAYHIMLGAHSGGPATFWSFWNRQNTSQMRFRWGTAGEVDWSFSPALTTGIWYNWVLTHDGSATALYLNGSPIGSVTTGALSTPATSALIFSGYGSTSCPNAGFDDLGVFDYAIGDARIKLIHGLAATNDLNYNLGEVNQLFVGYDTSTAAVIDGRNWYRFSGETGGTAGTVEDLGNGDYRVWFDSTSGMGPTAPSAAIPEPASLGLIGLALVGLRKRTRT